MDIGTPFPADGQASELVQQRQGLFNDPATSGDLVAGAPAWDVAGDLSLREFVIHARIVVTLVRDQSSDPPAWPAWAAAQRSYPIEELGQHQMVVDVGR